MLVTDAPFTIRRAAPHMVAEIAVEGGRARAAARGFRALAGYIFGRNAARAKIAMTAPVTQHPAEGSAARWHVRFVVPSDVARSGPPVPSDPRVRLVAVPAETQAAITFSGGWGNRRLAARADALRAWAAERGLPMEEPPRYQFYDDPFTLPFRRRNEVVFRLPDAG